MEPNVRSTPRHRRTRGIPPARFRPAVLAAGCIACIALMLSACSGGKETTSSNPATADTLPPVTELPPDTARDLRNDATLGEQLGRLDARMQTAPPDSLPILRAEYQRLLDLAAGTAHDVQTGAGGGAPAERPAGTNTSGETGDTLVGPDGLLGFRSSELSSGDTGTGGGRPAARPRVVSRTGSTAADVAAEERAADAVTAERGRQRSYVDGLAAVQAGRYPQAVKDLSPIASNPPRGKQTTARFAYARALEKTGNTKKAAEEYRAASAGTDQMAHKSYLNYCRLLAKSGKREQARKLLVEFIGRHPSSTQTVDARRLLQTL